MRATGDPRLRSAPAALALALAAASAALLAGCSSSTPSASGSGSGASTSTTTPGSPTTTTTTLPVPVAVSGTTVGGPVGFLGTVSRVSVVPIPPGHDTATIPPAGSLAASMVGRVAFRRFGSGTPLVLVAGEDASMSSWDPNLLSLLAQHFEVVLFDLPATGYTPAPSGSRPPPTLRSWADATAGLIRSLGLTKPLVMGWGLGGDVALYLAETHPGFLSGLVLADTPAGAPGAPTPPDLAARLRTPWLTMAALSKIWFTAAQRAARQAWLQAVLPVPPDALTQAARSVQFSVADEVAGSSTLVDGLASVRVPTLVVFGSSDPVVPPANSWLLIDHLPVVRVLRVAGGDYAAIFESAPAVVGAIQKLTG